MNKILLMICVSFSLLTQVNALQKPPQQNESHNAKFSQVVHEGKIIGYFSFEFIRKTNPPIFVFGIYNENKEKIGMCELRHLESFLYEFYEGQKEKIRLEVFDPSQQDVVEIIAQHAFNMIWHQE